MEDTEKNLQKNLLPQYSGEEGEGLGLTWFVFFEEVKRLGVIAGPMIATIVSLYLLEVLAMMMTGHLGELALSSTAMAISLANVTGFSVLNGMASALETLCGQAYGARQYRKLGNQTYSAIFSLVLVCILMCIVWINMEKLLLLMGQDPEISREAGRFILWLIPAFFGYAIFQPIIRYYQAQTLILPMLACCAVTLALHIPLSYVLIFKSGLEAVGGALAIGISNWLNAFFLALYMMYSPSCAKTRVPVSTEFFQEIGEFFRFAVPSAIMVCLQWWSYECVVLLSGLLPNPQLETSVLSVCLTTIATLYSIPFGLSAAVSTRVSNELGGGKPQAAKVAVYAVMFLAVAELILVSGTLFVTRSVFGYIFSNEKEVVDYVSSMAPLVCLSVIIDGLQGVLSGVARGTGWQLIGAYINLGALYLCGVPAAAALGFWFKFKTRGLWIGIQIGAVLQTVLLAVVTGCTNWEKQADKARDRIFERRVQ